MSSTGGHSALTCSRIWPFRIYTENDFQIAFSRNVIGLTRYRVDSAHELVMIQDELLLDLLLTLMSHEQLKH